MRKPTKQLLIAGVSLMLATTIGHAQTLSGRSESKQDRQALGAINIKLLDQEGKMLRFAVSDANGNFSIQTKGLERGVPYMLELTHIGYQTLRRRVSLSAQDMQLGSLALEEEARQLDQLTVIARGKALAEGYTVFPSERAKAQSTDGYDLIRKIMLPDVRVSSSGKSITTLDGRAVQIYINDKPATPAEMLMLKGKLTTRVEHLDAPGAEYGDAAAVIKLYTRPEESGWVGGFGLTNAFTTLVGENFGFLKHNHRTAEYGLSYENSYTHTRRRNISQEDEYLFSSAAAPYSVVREGKDRKLGFFQHKVTLNYNRTQGKKSIFNASLTGSWYDSKHRGYTQMIKEGTLPNYLAHTTPEERYLSPELELFYRRLYERGDVLRLNFYTTYIATDYSYVYREERNQTTAKDYSYTTKGRKLSLIGEGRYDHKLGKQTLSFGGRYLVGRTDNSYYGQSAEEQTLLSNLNLYNYAQLSGSLGKLKYNVGLGLRYILSNQGDYHAGAWLVEPRLTMSHPIPQGQLQYSFMLSPTAPTLTMLSGVMQRSTRWDAYEGNPLLEAYSTMNNRLTIRQRLGQALSATLRLEHSYAHKPILPLIQRRMIGADEVFVEQYHNLGRTHRGSAQLTLSWNALPEVLSLSASTGYKRYDVKSTSYHHRLDNFTAGLDADLTLGSWNFMLGVYTKETALVGETKTTTPANLHLALRKQLGNWTVGLNATNIFAEDGPSQSIELLNAMHRSRQYITLPSMSNMVGVFASWRFSTGRRHSAGEPSISNSDRDAGLVKF